MSVAVIAIIGAALACVVYAIGFARGWDSRAALARRHAIAQLRDLADVRSEGVQ